MTINRISTPIQFDEEIKPRSEALNTNGITQIVVSFLPWEDRRAMRLACKKFNEQVVAQVRAELIAPLDRFVTFLSQESQTKDAAFVVSENERATASTAPLFVFRHFLYAKRKSLIGRLVTYDTARLQDLETTYKNGPLPPLFINIFALVRIHKEITQDEWNYNPDTDEPFKSQLKATAKLGEPFEALCMAKKYHLEKDDPDAIERRWSYIFKAYSKTCEPFDVETINKLQKLVIYDAETPMASALFRCYVHNAATYFRKGHYEPARFYFRNLVEQLDKQHEQAIGPYGAVNEGTRLLRRWAAELMHFDEEELAKAFSLKDLFRLITYLELNEEY